MNKKHLSGKEVKYSEFLPDQKALTIKIQRPLWEGIP